MFRATPFVTAAFALTLHACAGALFAQAPQVADPRIVINRLDPEFLRFNAVGTVTPVAKTADGVVVMRKLRSSGVLISPCHLLMHDQAVFDDARGEVLFEAGQPDGKRVAGFALRGVGRIIDAGVRHAEADMVDDWALVKLIDPQSGRSHNLGEQTGFFPFAAAPPAAVMKQPLMTAGYPAGMDAGLMAHAGCRLARVDADGRWRVACAITDGQVGGPLTLRTADRGDILIAINSATAEGRSGLIGTEEVRWSHLNYATALTRASETRIRRSMEASRCD